ncbi:HesA/MoeB/ThiF family protein [Marinigracilibium pacificum]|uniref:Molybdopterin-synthase adenylyltransferase n=1 Tax=Marinigracilibium pacificum TaxID=2729599 RepID=A0A848J176_9BACT|nr:HesA/MoeB/ThiF family protein [Marinigracilibium pacificum]NMM48300.1 HesA/MoeB/ThiF family protein [Marinigracilibium pacificum]
MNRYDRQIKLTEVGAEGQQKLLQASVLIIGVGGLGCPAAQYLVGAGVGKVGLMDHDVVSITNLHRQVLYNESDIGKPKVIAAYEKLRSLNSEIEIVTYNEALTIENAINRIKEYDLVIDGSDNLETKYLINDACILADKPWVYASIYKNEGQLAVFNYQEGPGYRCLFPVPAYKNISCETTGVLGVTPGLLGILQSIEALKIILDTGDILYGRVKLINILTGAEQVIKIRPQKEEIEKIKKHGIIPVKVFCELSDKGKTYLDVRDTSEQPRINDKNVITIPMNDLRNRVSEIPSNDEVLVFCQSGIRSKKAIEILRSEFGFQNLKNVEGGLNSIING